MGSTHLDPHPHTDLKAVIGCLIDLKAVIGCPIDPKVKNASGKWVSADPIPGTFVCNVGDMFKVWTNGLYQPTVHRVVNVSRCSSSLPTP
jgi:isopenicillin N synthase-like dioxygenase